MRPIRLGLILLFALIVVEASAQEKDLLLKPSARIQQELETIQGGKARNLWAVIVGVNKYEDPKIRSLRYAVADAEAIQGIISDRRRMPYRNVVSMVYTDTSGKKPTQRNILRGFIPIKNQAGPDDTVLFFFSGHGVQVNGVSYLLPCDAEADMIEHTAIALEDINRELMQVKAARQVVILDACHSGGVFISEGKFTTKGIELKKRTRSVKSVKLATQIMAEAEGRIVLSSSKSGEVSYEYPEKGQGVFTYYLVEGLKGKADSDDNGYITVSEAYKYVYQSVLQWSKRHNRRQTPTREAKVSGEVVLTIIPDIYLASSSSSGQPSPQQTAPNPLFETEVKIAPYDGAEMVLIPAGKFVMGSSPGEGREDEVPQHEVYLDDFYIDLHEVTNAQYRLFVEATGHPEPPFWDDERFNKPDQPVVGVSWFDAHEYAKWVGRRLPTEAEWEKAARGIDRRIYPWGNEWTAEGKAMSAPQPVGSNKLDVSPYGIVDMAGNVSEWVADFYSKDYYRSSVSWVNPLGPTVTGFIKLKVIRGASWKEFSSKTARCANRGHNIPSMKFNFVGFRLAMDKKAAGP
jgi:iron(II)-dependent oxidoreductase